jgi:hypothetical protein
MGVCGFFDDDRELRLKDGDVAGTERGAVLRGEISVERAQKKDAERLWRPGARYRRIEEYDAVLRSHCRLDDLADAEV